MFNRKKNHKPQPTPQPKKNIKTPGEIAQRDWWKRIKKLGGLNFDIIDEEPTINVRYIEIELDVEKFCINSNEVANSQLHQALKLDKKPLLTGQATVLIHFTTEHVKEGIATYSQIFYKPKNETVYNSQYANYTPQEFHLLDNIRKRMEFEACALFTAFHFPNQEAIKEAKKTGWGRR